MPTPATLQKKIEKDLAKCNLRRRDASQKNANSGASQLHFAITGDAAPAAQPSDLSLADIQASVDVISNSPLPTVLPSNSRPTIPRSATNRIPHRESTALSVLDAIDKQLHNVHEKLDSVSTVTALDEVSETLHNLHISIPNGSTYPSVVDRRKKVQTHFDTIDNKMTMLYSAAPPETGPVVFSADSLYDSKALGWSATSQVIAFIGFIGHCFTFLGITTCNLFMQLAELAVRSAYSVSASERFSRSQEYVLDQIPKTLHTALKLFNLDSKMSIYAVCPSCKYTHSPVKSGSGIQHWPDSCCRPLDDGSTCKTPLLVRRRFGLRPIVPYLVPSFPEYLARLLSNAEVERACCEIVDDAFKKRNEPITLMSTVFDGEFARTFNGPDGGLFVDRKDKIRLLFSLNHDQFPPRGGGKRTHSNHSLGVFALAPLNLDPSIRYDPDSMYITVLPGPRGPTGDEVAYLLDPIAVQLEEAWSRGIRLSRTGLCSEGATVEAAVACKVCDLVGARHSAGYAGHNSKWICTVCALYGREKVWETDSSKWPPRNNNKLREHAEQYREATSEERSRLFNTHGLRWSAMWKLPYWNPIQQLVVDPMHNLLEGLVHAYCRYILGLSFDQINSRGSPANAYEYFFEPYNDHDCPDAFKINNAKERKQISRIHELLLHPITPEFTTDILRRRLESMNNPALRFVLHSLKQDEQDIELDSAKTKSQLVDLLVSWRSNKPLKGSKDRPPIVTRELMLHIQNVIRNSLRPSWFTTVPLKFGEKQAGTPKADQWRALATVYLPIALVTFWGDDDGCAPEDSYHLAVLDHAMLLFQAVTIAMRYNLTPKLATTYLQLITQWVNDLRKLFPKLRDQVYTRTNFHMCLHIYDFMIQFGPAVNWWCFPFERLNGTLQNLTTNDRVGGQMEATMVKSWYRAGNLRRWLKHPKCPPVFTQLLQLYNKAFPHSQSLNTASSVPSKTFSADRAYYSVSSYLGRIIFSRFRTHAGNSIILFHPEDSPTSLVAGQIVHIEAGDGADPVFRVQRHLPLPEGLYDPFSRYESFPAWSYSSDISERVEGVPYENVVGHGVRFSYSRNRCVVVNLSR